ncbi:MAG: hypothetical protein K6F91_09030 [Ruminococcus sp.]|nr:hypothetical protein [Ruminococcus sp.]
MNKNRLTACILSLLLCCSFIGCNEANSPSNSSESSAATTTEPKKPSAVDDLNADELNIYNHLVEYSDKLVTPNSLRLSAWVKGEVVSDETYRSLGFKSGDTLEYVQVLADNRGGKLSNGFAYIDKSDNTFKTINTSDSIYSKFSNPAFLLSNMFVAEEESVTKINRALNEFFAERGY